MNKIVGISIAILSFCLISCAPLSDLIHHTDKGKILYIKADYPIYSGKVIAKYTVKQASKTTVYYRENEMMMIVVPTIFYLRIQARDPITGNVMESDINVTPIKYSLIKEGEIYSSNLVTERKYKVGVYYYDTKLDLWQHGYDYVSEEYAEILKVGMEVDLKYLMDKEAA